MWVGLILVWASVLFVWYRIKSRRYFQLGSKVPAPPGHPFIGHSYIILRNPEKIFCLVRDIAISKKYPRMMAIWLGPRLNVLMYDPADLQIVLKETHIEKAKEYKFLSPWLGDGSLLSTECDKVFTLSSRAPFAKEIFSLMKDMSKRYSRLMAIWIGPKLYVFMYDPGDVNIVLKKSVIEKADEYQLLRPWLGNGSLLSSGTKYKTHRKIIMPALQSKNLKNRLHIMNDSASQFAKSLEEKVGKGQFDITEYISLATMNSFLESILAVKKETFDEYSLPYVRAVTRVGRLSHIRQYKIWLHPDIFYRYSRLKKELDKQIEVINALTDRVINDRRQIIENGNDESDQEEGAILFLDYLLKAKKDDGEPLLSNEEIRDEVNTMMFAGHDTTTVSIGFALTLLGIYQDIQNKVLDELDAVFGDSQRPINYEDIQNLRYLEQVIQETWRLYPPVPMIARKTSNEVRLDGYTLPKGCTLLIVLMQLHRNPLIYPNPHRFNPDNFSPENIKSRHPCSFLPFSAGQRTCFGPRYAGLVIKVFLATLLRRYKISSSMKESDFVLAAQTTLKLKNGFGISLEERRLS